MLRKQKSIRWSEYLLQSLPITIHAMRPFNLLIFILFCPVLLAAQDSIPWKHRGPVWFTPASETKIHGVSVGAFHFSFNPKKPTKVNGVSVELGLGLLIGMGMSESPSDAHRSTVAEFDSAPCLNQINGLSVSLLGETIGFVAPGEVRGLSLSGSMGMVFRVRGVQLAPLGCINWEWLRDNVQNVPLAYQMRRLVGKILCSHLT
ncbi:MAG: hypothetical protein H7246_22075, partial [Phycisphaerae bacterium]|nr:hypothetical protein [Saprospiraceae bacterium]